VPVDFEYVPVRLDWNAFSTRSFPGSRRHDLQTISAYDAYSRGGRRPESTGGAEKRGSNQPPC